MLGPRHVLTVYQKKMVDTDYEKHLKRLEEIQKPKRKIVEEKDLAMRSTFVDLHNKHLQFQTTEKLGSLDKTNKALLNKLVKISRNEKPPLFKSTSWTNHPGTLNMTYRKKELMRIAQENEALARRLISQQSAVDHKKLQLDFVKHQVLVKNSRKIPDPSPKLIAKLPPLKSPKTEGSPQNKREFRFKNKQKARIGPDGNAVTSVTQQEETVEETHIKMNYTQEERRSFFKESEITKEKSEIQEDKNEEELKYSYQISQRQENEIKHKNSDEIKSDHSLSTSNKHQNKEKNEDDKSIDKIKEEEKEIKQDTDQSANISEAIQNSRTRFENKEVLSAKVSNPVSIKESKVLSEIQELEGVQEKSKEQERRNSEEEIEKKVSNEAEKSQLAQSQIENKKYNESNDNNN